MFGPYNFGGPILASARKIVEEYLGPHGIGGVRYIVRVADDGTVYVGLQSIAEELILRPGDSLVVDCGPASVPPPGNFPFVVRAYTIRDRQK